MRAHASEGVNRKARGFFILSSQHLIKRGLTSRATCALYTLATETSGPDPRLGNWEESTQSQHDKLKASPLFRSACTMADRRRDSKMTADSTQKKNRATVLADVDLNEVTGGYDKYHDESSDRHYLWNGTSADQKYVCPNCGRPVKSGFLSLTFSCSPCNASWYYERRLKPNFSAGGWQEISKDDYDKPRTKDPYFR